MLDAKYFIYETFIGQLGWERGQKVNRAIKQDYCIDLWHDLPGRGGVTKHLHPHTLHQVSYSLKRYGYANIIAYIYMYTVYAQKLMCHIHVCISLKSRCTSKSCRPRNGAAYFSQVIPVHVNATLEISPHGQQWYSMRTCTIRAYKLTHYWSCVRVDLCGHCPQFAAASNRAL